MRTRKIYVPGPRAPKGYYRFMKQRRRVKDKPPKSEKPLSAQAAQELQADLEQEWAGYRLDNTIIRVLAMLCLSAAEKALLIEAGFGREFAERNDPDEHAWKRAPARPKKKRKRLYLKGSGKDCLLDMFLDWPDFPELAQIAMLEYGGQNLADFIRRKQRKWKEDCYGNALVHAWLYCKKHRNKPWKPETLHRKAMAMAARRCWRDWHFMSDLGPWLDREGKTIVGITEELAVNLGYEDGTFALVDNRIDAEVILRLSGLSLGARGVCIQLMDGMDYNGLVKEMIDLGVSRATAYRRVKEWRQELEKFAGIAMDGVVEDAAQEALQEVSDG